MKAKRYPSYTNLSHIGTVHSPALIGGQAEVFARITPFHDLLVELRANGAKLRIPFNVGNHPPTDPEIIQWVADYLSPEADPQTALDLLPDTDTEYRQAQAALFDDTACLPLFSGTAPRAHVKPFVEQDAPPRQLGLL